MAESYPPFWLIARCDHNFQPIWEMEGRFVRWGYESKPVVRPEKYTVVRHPHGYDVMVSRRTGRIMGLL